MHHSIPNSKSAKNLPCLPKPPDTIRVKKCFPELVNNPEGFLVYSKILGGTLKLGGWLMGRYHCHPMRNYFGSATAATAPPNHLPQYYLWCTEECYSAWFLIKMTWMKIANKSPVLLEQRALVSLWIQIQLYHCPLFLNRKLVFRTVCK